MVTRRIPTGDVADWLKKGENRRNLHRLISKYGGNALSGSGE